MAAYPFRKMTTRQLKKLLQDDRDRDESLKMQPGRQAETTQHFPTFKNHPVPTNQQSESINQ